MNEQDMLHHLLEVESEAASLVHDAQAEADKRVAENEKQNRSRFDDHYTQEVALLEKDYQDAIAKVKHEYNEELDAYRAGFQNRTVDNEGFITLARSFLFEGS